ncbi:sialate O-acetylesterase [Niabella ginsenosidivorans]|nr:sialate O-acetylesterase [Niabella ginsenosidivorans]
MKSLLKGMFLLSAFASLNASAQIKLPRILRDSMVLQRNAKINIWGWASKGERVSVRFNSQTYRAITGNDGKWAVQLAPVKAGGPYKMEIAGKNKIILKELLVGDVWLCAGQSNMEHQMKLHDIIYANEIAAADFPQIRQFKVPNTVNLQAPQDDLPSGSWTWAGPAGVRDFSAVAYFFAKALYEKYQVPIGIINSSWGGIPIEAMMSEKSLQPFPDVLAIIEKNKDTAYINRSAHNEPSGAQPSKIQDRGLTEQWYAPSYHPKGWRPFAVPGYWEDQGVKDLDGTVWFRREIEVPQPMTQRGAKVFLGRIVDADELYINGTKVGATYYMYPQRRYAVPDGLLKPGKNLFVIKISNKAGKGGFVPDKPYQLIAGNDTIDLTGYWQYKVGEVNAPARGGKAGNIALQNQPGALYNTMIAPLTNYTLKGFVWYQGESNTGNAAAYAKLQPAMIQDWRAKWQSRDLPFLFVQLPGFMDYSYWPAESDWALFREAQAQTLSLPNTAMAVAIDLGEWNDIHPDRKKEVGDRLALAAGKIAYGENIVYSGPSFQSAVIDGNKMMITFKNTGSGLCTSDGEPPAEFAIAGADKKFVWADAKIEGRKIVVSSNEIAAPRYVRYAWADDPVHPNLINKEGLPAAPFRTDE